MVDYCEVVMWFFIENMNVVFGEMFFVVIDIDMNYIGWVLFEVGVDFGLDFGLFEILLME